MLWLRYQTTTIPWFNVLSNDDIFIFIILNLIIDIVYAFIDPRIRLQKAKNEKILEIFIIIVAILIVFLAFFTKFSTI